MYIVIVVLIFLCGFVTGAWYASEMALSRAGVAQDQRDDQS